MERSEEVQAKLSASKLEASSLCPAFFQASKKFTWNGDRDSATEGTIRHENEENQVPLEDIDDDERRKCAYRSRIALAECREKVFGDKVGIVAREARYWYGDLWSGQLDYMETSGVDVLIADYKTLHGSHTPAPKNIQLLAQAILVVKNHPDIENVYAVLIEPFNDPTYTTVKYSRKYLEEKAMWLEEVAKRAYSDNPDQVAGPKQCKWCNALYVCPTARTAMVEILNK